MDGHACKAVLGTRTVEGHQLESKEAALTIWLFLALTIFLLGDAVLLYWLWRTGRIGRSKGRGWADREG